MSLSPEQQKQIDLQMQEHNHDRYEVNIKLSEKEVLSSLIVYPHVLRPELTTAQYLAQWLFQNKELYKNKMVIDLGCGTGIQGIIMGLYGAKHITFSDISKESIKNTQENLTKFNLKTKSTIVLGDLFEKIKNKADIIVFNHPFFPGEPLKDEPVSLAMLDSGELIQRFLEEAKKFLTPKGRIIMPYFYLGGEINNPAIQAPKHDYKVAERFREKINHGFTLQQGEVSIYELEPRQ